MDGRSRTLGWARRLLLYLFVAALLAAARPTRASVVTGALVAALGEAIRIWAAGYLVKTTILVTSGPYARTRNPLYLGRLLLLTGLALAATLPYHLNLVVLAAGYAVFFIYYLPRKERVEGERLRRRHGGLYEAYRSAVPPLRPALRRFAGSHVAWSSALMLRNREPLVLVGLALLFGLLAFKIGGRESRHVSLSSTGIPASYRTVTGSHREEQA